LHQAKIDKVNNDHPTSLNLHDDLIVKVSSLLLDDIGTTRTVNVELSSFPLDDDLTAEDVRAKVRLTRLNTGILAQGSAEGLVEMECVRCLNQFEQPFTARFTEQFRQTAAVGEGRGFVPPSDSEVDEEGDSELAFEINDAHELDLTELLRQWILLALPMTPACGPDCPGPLQIENGDDESGDARFAALQQLLDTEEQ
jgi:uncharacterized protein